MSLAQPTVWGTGLARALGYCKLRQATVGVLVLDSGYHLQGECAEALRDAGHRVSCLPCGGEATASSLLRALLHALVAERPDFVLSINHLGLDSAGTIEDLLRELRMPLAVWYVDSPFFVLRGDLAAHVGWASLFCWERSYLPWLRAAGAEQVAHLPLGCAPRRWERAAAPAAVSTACFVGDSMQGAERKWRARLAWPARAAADGLATSLAARQGAFVAASEHALGTGGQQAWDTLAYATFLGTARYRNGLLRHLARQTPLCVVGDAAWKQACPQAAARPSVAYGPELCALYRAAPVQVNATSLQMPTAVNQRVFDVPTAGGFVLSDAQEDLTSLFAPGRECVTYRDADELADLTTYYLARPRERAAIGQAARARVLGEHTYGHRVAALVAAMRRWHAPRATSAAPS